ncbi:ent-kaurene synthase, partial [Genlisea aurea]
TRILKTSYHSPNFATKEFLNLSHVDFNDCQEMHRNELNELQRWVVDNKLDDLKFARQKIVYCYFSAAASIFSPEMSDSRMSWAKNAYFTIVIDDLFDTEGSVEELEDLIHFVERWDVDIEAQCCSESVKIIFPALKGTICEVSEKAYAKQGRSVTDHVIQIWLDLLYAFKKEAEWRRENSTPSIDEYMANASTSFALGPIVLPALYLVGPKLSNETVHHHPEYRNLFRLMSNCGRLLNDIQSCEREMKEGKLNAVPLYSIEKKTTKEASIEQIRRLIEGHRRELMGMVMQKSAIPKPCKDVFFHMLKVLHLFYRKDD